MSGRVPRLLIVGGGTAGLAAAATAARICPGEVWVIDRAPLISVATCALPYLVGGQIEEAASLVLHQPEQLLERGIVVHTGSGASEIDLKGHRLRLENGRWLDFEQLMLAPGGARHYPGEHFANVLSPRDLESSLRARAWLEQPQVKTVLIAGAGYLGLELAEAARRRGRAVVLVDPSPTLLGLPPELHRVLLDELESQGVEWIPSRVVAWEGQGLASHALLEDGSRRAFELAFWAAGCPVRNPLLESLPLERGEAGGLRINSRGETSRRGVYAAGDCCEIPHPEGGWVHQPLARPAALLGQVAGANACGQSRRFQGCWGSLSLKVFGLEVAWVKRRRLAPQIDSCQGDWPLRPGYWPNSDRVHLQLDFAGPTGPLQAAWAVGHEVTSLMQTLSLALAQNLDAEALSQLEAAYTPPLSPMWDPISRTARQAKRWA